MNMIIQSFIFHHGDVTDSTKLDSHYPEIQPDEIYNLAAQSHVAFHLKRQNIPQMRMHWERCEF